MNKSKLFPTKQSIIAWAVFYVSVLWILLVTICLPLAYSAAGMTFTPPDIIKVANVMFLMGIFIGAIFYALERDANKE